MKPPEVITTASVTLRRWHPEMAEALDAAISESLPELKAFMPWANDEHGLKQTKEYVDRSVTEWESGESFNFALVGPDGAVIGSSGLMTRMGPGVLEIGYWVHSAYAGRGIATAAAGALAEAGACLDGVDRLAIKHDIANPASGRVAEKLGFKVVREEQRDPTTATADSGVDRVWELQVSQRSTSVISNE